ncbi:VOC family protein [Ruegeria arenilitoris]|uniref:VOC family protein n=1 Tax=Ruegeria arenilitoris TaxID=1173585 RepID=UPI0020C43E75|nr:VOC family protein [Ruegeria arenilitoris]
MSENRGFQPRALGEIAIRCADMGAMVTFYEDVIGLTRLSGDHNSAITFFRSRPVLVATRKFWLCFTIWKRPGPGCIRQGRRHRLRVADRPCITLPCRCPLMSKKP